MEDKTGVFTRATAVKEAEATDRHEEDTLAAIFGKKKEYSRAQIKTDDSAEISVVHDKTMVIEKAPGEKAGFPAAKSVTDNIQATKIIDAIDDEEDDGQPYAIKNTAYDKARRKRKSRQMRERQIRQLKAQQSQKTFAYVFGGILLVVFIVSVSAFFSYYIIQAAIDFTGITVNEFGIEVSIPPDAMTEEIAAILAEKGLISQPRFFTLYSQLFGHDGKYLDGLFMLENSMSYGDLVRNLQSTGSVRETVMITITEGMTSEQVGLLLEENNVCLAEDFAKHYNEMQDVFSFERRVPLNHMKFHQLEGYLFPDTYEFFVVPALRDNISLDSMTESERESLANRARIAAHKIYDNFNTQITPEMYKRMNEQGFTLNELMTLASLVQAEAAEWDDMQKVASVFINRLNNPETFPYLQSSPTEYYIRDFIMPHVSQRNTSLYQSLMNAYNTDISPGLPPGPINNPGIEAIMAVLDARKTDYYYFCANIETGEVFYATNYADHQANLALVDSQMVLIS